MASTQPIMQRILGAAFLVLLLGLVAYRATDRQNASPASPASPPPPERVKHDTCTVYDIIDGDTLDCREGRQRIRLLLIDAPEMEQGSLGRQAAEHLASLAPRGSVLQLELDRESRDQYGRLLAYAWRPDGRMINEAMVRDGYALTFSMQPNIKYRDRIRAAKRLAQARRAGLWAVGGFACAPVAFRHGRCH